MTWYDWFLMDIRCSQWLNLPYFSSFSCVIDDGTAEAYLHIDDTEASRFLRINSTQLEEVKSVCMTIGPVYVSRESSKGKVIQYFISKFTFTQKDYFICPTISFIYSFSTGIYSWQIFFFNTFNWLYIYAYYTPTKTKTCKKVMR